MTTALVCLLLLLTTPLWILSVLGEVEKYWGDPLSVSADFPSPALLPIPILRKD